MVNCQQLGLPCLILSICTLPCCIYQCTPFLILILTLFRYLENNKLSSVLPTSWSLLSNLNTLYVSLLRYLYLQYSLDLLQRTLKNNRLSGQLPASWSALTELVYL